MATSKRSRRASHDVSPRMRKAFFEGFILAAQRNGGTTAEYCQKLWEEDWKKAAELLTKFLPRENVVKGKVEHEHSGTVELSATERFLEEITAPGEERAFEEPVQDGPVLPH